MTIDEFLRHRCDLPDGGQWTELVHGAPHSLEPPEFSHGATILNFSKALGEHLHAHPGGYAVFDLGVVVGRNPDTIRFPAVSFFQQGRMFAQADEEVSHLAPCWVVEVVSSPDRKQGLTTRVEQYFDCGVKLLWLLETRQKEVTTWQPGRRPESWREGNTVTALPILSGFRIPVSDVFREPEW